MKDELRNIVIKAINFDKYIFVFGFQLLILRLYFSLVLRVLSKMRKKMHANLLILLARKNQIFMTRKEKAKALILYPLWS